MKQIFDRLHDEMYQKVWMALIWAMLFYRRKPMLNVLMDGEQKMARVNEVERITEVSERVRGRRYGKTIFSCIVQSLSWLGFDLRAVRKLEREARANHSK